MKNRIFCTPAECVKLRRKHTNQELFWASEVMAFYGCRAPNTESAQNMREFVADVFAAGRISGVREERRKRAPKSQTFANFK